MLLVVLSLQVELSFYALFGLGRLQFWNEVIIMEVYTQLIR